MKEFFSRYSYKMVKMFITQIAVGLFGAVLTFVASGISNTFLVIVSALAILFYLFLLYTTAWEMGASDKISIDVGKLRARPYMGIIISLIANIPNFIIAIIQMICWFVAHGAESAATNVAAAMRIVTVIAEGMYYGLMTAITLGTRINASGEIVPRELFNYWWSYFLIIIPAVLLCGIAYLLGTKNYHLTKMMEPVYPESDRDPKPKNDKRNK